MVVRSPCQERYPADAHPSALKSVLELANPRMDSEGASGCPWSTARGNSPVSGTANPGVVKQDKSSRGSVDTTKTRSDPQRVRMCSGERPIGAAKGKQSDTEALCQPPPPPKHKCQNKEEGLADASMPLPKPSTNHDAVVGPAAWAQGLLPRPRPLRHRSGVVEGVGVGGVKRRAGLPVGTFGFKHLGLFRGGVPSAG